MPAETGLTSLSDPDVQFPNINGVTYDETFCDREFTSPFVYVTAEFASDLLPSDGEFIVGAVEGQPNDRSMYVNGLLCYSKRYTIFLRAYTFANDGNQVLLLWSKINVVLYTVQPMFITTIILHSQVNYMNYISMERERALISELHLITRCT